MSGRPFDHPRWGDDALAPKLVSSPSTYSSTPTGPVRRAALYDGGLLLGYVWTDDRQAAGFFDDASAGSAGVQAGGKVWAIHRDAYRDGRPASDLLDPELYASVGRLDVSSPPQQGPSA